MKKIWNHLCRGQKTFRLSAITSAASKRRCIWRGAEDLTFTFFVNIRIITYLRLYFFNGV